jgi:diaminopimelate decarboxylase
LRLQLKWEKKQQHSVLGGNSITAFGMDIQTAKYAISILELPFLGFHVFQWGNCSTIEELEYIWKSTILSCKAIHNNFQVLDVGGGIGIPYNTNEKSLPWYIINKVLNTIKHKVTGNFVFDSRFPQQPSTRHPMPTNPPGQR